MIDRVAYPSLGSGTLEISPSPVLAVADRTRTFQLKYTAATDLGDADVEAENVQLRIFIPIQIGLPQDADCQFCVHDPADDDYVSGSGTNLSVSVL